jgi:hypothetical protein
VSLTLELRRAGELRWFVTKESGMVPFSCAEGSCLVCGYASTCSAKDRRGSFAVLNIPSSEGESYGAPYGRVLFANLSRDSVAVLCRVATTTESERGSGKLNENLHRLVGRGGYGGSPGCACSVVQKGFSVCKQCLSLQRSGVRTFWSVPDLYKEIVGVHGISWFFGVSDSVEAADSAAGNSGMSWVLCNRWWKTFRGARATEKGRLHE